MARQPPGPGRALGDHLGPNLIQLPPRWRRDTARLDAFLEAAPKHIRWAVELRDPSWVHDDTFEVLARHGAALCVHDMLENHPWLLTSDWTYVRFHGPASLDPALLYQGRYTGSRLRRPAERLVAWRDTGIDVYAYFNNDYFGNAFTDATWLRNRLEAEAPVSRR